MSDSKKRSNKHIFDDDRIEQKNAGKKKHSTMREFDDEIDLEEDDPYIDLIDDRLLRRIK
jgi:hypothetical protein